MLDSKHTAATVCCVGHHFVILYACVHIVLFHNHGLLHLVWEQD